VPVDFVGFAHDRYSLDIAKAIQLVLSR
jgi:hypothetical protein